MGQIKWRRNANGPRGPDADYIMANDRYAEDAFKALRKRGLPKGEAKRQIEECFAAAFWWMMFTYCKDNVRPPDPRPRCWFELAEGMTVERIFPDLEELGNWNPSRGTAEPLQ